MEVVTSSHQKDVFQKKQKTNVKVFNMITNKNEAKTMVKRISCEIVNTNYSTTTCNSNQKWNNETCQCECKNYCTRKTDYSWNPSTCICEDDKYLKVFLILQ